MLEQIKYRNHLGTEIDFNANGVYVKSTNLRDYSWNCVQRGGKISSFKRGVVNKKITLYINCDTIAEGTNKKNELTRIFEQDISAKQPGEIIVDNIYCLSCYITGSVKSEYLITKKSMSVELNVVSDNPVWYTKSPVVINSEGETITSPFGFDANFRLEILGATTDAPIILIKNTFYGINSALEAGERLIIDSFKKEVYKLTSTGEQVNMFSDRIVNGNYVFTKIPKETSGFLIFSGGTFDWNLKVYSEGSEPAWI